MATLVFDVECYPNFFLVLFKDIESGKVTRCQISPNRSLNRELLLQTLRNNLLVGFNSHDYDIPMIQLALNGYSTDELKKASEDIVTNGMGPRDFGEKHDISKPGWDNIDIINVAPLKASLKLYAARLHCRKLQDLPIDPNQPITPEQAMVIVEYCINDLDNTATLYRELEPQIKLREELSREYRRDLRSKSDAQVAEQVISAEVRKINGERPKRPSGLEGQSYSYRVPECIRYRMPLTQALLETIRGAKFTVGASGAIELPRELVGRDIKIRGGNYRIGIGGLHSSETCAAHVATEDTMLVDRDVTSYYPSIILTQRLIPQHLGEAFLTVYQSLVDRRIAAKKAGNKSVAESLKIAINGSFGKLGNKYSVLYAPDLLIQVTLSGQLLLLMLIEAIELEGIPVISANTDGVLIKCPTPRYQELLGIISAWEKATGMATEETLYSAVYSKDVNNYIAIKQDGKVKGKGLYTVPWGGMTEGPAVFKMHKNPCTTIVPEAVFRLLRDDVPVEETIRGCKDITKFTSVRTVNGGAKQCDVYIGKVVRWYYSTDNARNVMNYRKTGNKVPKSDGSKPLMMLPDEFPSDVNHAWYIAEAKETLRNIGYGQRTLWTN